jgi:hypothetical protein
MEPFKRVREVRFPRWGMPSPPGSRKQIRDREEEASAARVEDERIAVQGGDVREEDVEISVSKVDEEVEPVTKSG